MMEVKMRRRAIDAGDAINYSLHKTVHVEVEDEEEKFSRKLFMSLADGEKISSIKRKEFFFSIYLEGNL